ncbi:restriction endonuclease subunit S [Actinomadura graeca]|uniref:Restriction endonuclease subunit S n=1 Tax=Actinomadura graeca TaxID=2750812 RepID=A0ABX8QUM7_9ACTN|nr:restriction endonuclease subunit S [Actinomadura graeca]QXJ22442.1 restriction endonuclease subunit S [Actinomadura graeca]
MRTYGRVELGEFMVSRGGSIDPAKFTQEEFVLYSIPAFDEGAPQIVCGSEIGSTKQLVQAGDVLLSKIVPHIRRSWIVESDFKRRLIASGEWMLFRSDRFWAPYLRHLLVSDRFHSQFMNTVAGVGGSLLRARPSFVAKIDVPLPSLDEQRKIAEALDQADALRAKQREAVGLLDELTQSIFLEMFGDPLVNPNRWPTHQLATFFAIKPNYGTMTPASKEKKEYLCLRVANIQDWKIDFNNTKYVDLDAKSVARYTVSDGDLLMARAIASQEHLGKAIIARPGANKWAFDSHLMRIRLNESLLLPEFLQAFLRSNGGRRIFLKASRRSAVQFNINAKEMSALEIPAPPLAYQQEFAMRLREVEVVRTLHQSRAEGVDELFKSLQQRAFRGELWED